MGLLATCVFLVLPQEAPPAATPVLQDPPAANAHATSEDPAASTTAATATASNRDEDAKALAALEKRGENADPIALAQLASSSDAAVARRAAWVLGNQKNKAALRPLCDVVAQSPHADARTFAMQAVLRFQDVAATTTATDALRDSDRRVRTLAAEFLGKARRPAAIDALLGLIEADHTTHEAGDATDIQAALLALHDLGASDKLLRITTALHDSGVQGTGLALTFCCQSLSAKLPANEQVPFLLAILAHREPLVRRFAIGRLAELEDATAVKALEGRLAKENDELRPMVEAALTQIRKDKVAPPSDELARATQNLNSLVHTAKSWWNDLEPLHQGIAAGVPVVLLVAVVLLARARRRKARAVEAAATIALVQPSEEFAEQAAAEAEQLAAEAEQYGEEAMADGAEQEATYEDVAARR